MWLHLGGSSPSYFNYCPLRRSSPREATAVGWGILSYSTVVIEQMMSMDKRVPQDQNYSPAVVCPRLLIMPPPLIGGSIKRCFCLTSVCLTSVWCLSVAYIGPKSRTERPRKTKIGTELAHVTCDSDTTFKVKRSKVRVTRPLYSARP